MRFSVYTQTIEYQHRMLQRHFIVLRDDATGAVVRFTNFHEFIRGGKPSVARSIASHDRNRFIAVCQLLNYAFFDRYNINALTEISLETVKNFLRDYGLCELPTDNPTTTRKKEIVEKCVMYVIDFLSELLKEYPQSFAFKMSDLWEEREYFSKSKRRRETKRVPAFPVVVKDNFDAPLLRDLPEDVFQIIFRQVMNDNPRLLMLVALQAFAGLRPSEACNVRRVDSPLGPGMLFTIENGEVTNIAIDLRAELVLRSDGVTVGGIKKERLQRVYPAFLPAFVECYNIYMKAIEGTKYETEYGALSNNRNGMAFTYAAYNAAFKQIVENSIPTMLASSDSRVVNYGLLLQEAKIAPHIFRHWFTIKLVQYGENVAGLQYWRGDKSPESAITYIENKSDLIAELKKVTDFAYDFSQLAAQEMYGNV